MGEPYLDDGEETAWGNCVLVPWEDPWEEAVQSRLLYEERLVYAEESTLDDAGWNAHHGSKGLESVPIYRCGPQGSRGRSLGLPDQLARLI